MPRHPSRTYPLAVLAIVLLAGLMACGATTDAEGGSGTPAESGYAQRVMQETDASAKTFLPAAVTDLGVQVFTGQTVFVECDIAGWRYQADGELVGTLDPTTAVETLSTLMQAQGLEVEVRDNGSVVGRAGELSLLVGTPNTALEPNLRHYTFTHACASYAAPDEEFAASAAGTDYAQFVPAPARYTP